MSQSKKVVLDADKIKSYVEEFKGTIDVEFPELRGILNMSSEEMPVVTIKAASLDDQLRAQSIYEQTAIRALALVEWANGKDPNSDPIGLEKMMEEIRQPMHHKSFLEISIFHRCVVNPEFTMRQSVKISEVLPEVVNRVATAALEMSSLERLNGDSKRS